MRFSDFKMIKITKLLISLCVISGYNHICKKKLACRHNDLVTIFQLRFAGNVSQPKTCE